jgi:cell division protease FtsH
MRNESTDKTMSNNFKKMVVALLFLGAVVWLCLPQSSTPVEEISRARLDRMIAGKTIIRAKITPKQAYSNIYTIAGSYRPGNDRGPVDFTITTLFSESQINSLLQTTPAAIEIPQVSARMRVWDIVPTVLIGFLVVGLALYQTRMGKAKATHKLRGRPTIRFNDVAGVEEAKAEVQEVIDFLRDPAKYHKLGGNLPKGILLIGPPGTGKTMLARAIAGEANANFFSASGSDFNEIYVGVGAKRIRELFAQARKAKPSIIFIDEIDCLGKSRKQDQNGELQQTNNALLTEMDGFDSSEGVIVVAATNRPEDLDEALMRPGRFDRKVHVPLPDQKGRRAILQTHSKKAPITAPEHALSILAQTTPGMSGADLANVINEAAILCAQKGKSEIGLSDLEEARDKVRWGKERKSMCLNSDERRVIAYHEAGHAIVGLEQPLLPGLHKVTIIPRGNSLGSTLSMPKEDQNIHSKTFLLQQLRVLMGGRAAEALFIGDITNGANGDLDAAKNIARKMIHDWGMGKRLFYEPEKSDAEMEINTLLATAYQEAEQLVLKRRDNTEKLAEALLVEETLTREQVLELLEDERDAEPIVSNRITKRTALATV